MAKAPFRYPAAIVTWLDAHTRNQAVEYDESEVSSLHRPEECTILALVIRDDDEGLSVFNEQTGPSSIRGLGFIPRKMVKSVTYVNLTPVRPRKRHSDTRSTESNSAAQKERATPRAESPEVEP